VLKAQAEENEIFYDLILHEFGFHFYKYTSIKIPTSIPIKEHIPLLRSGFEPFIQKHANEEFRLGLGIKRITWLLERHYEHSRDN